MQGCLIAWRNDFIWVFKSIISKRSVVSLGFYKWVKLEILEQKPPIYNKSRTNLIISRKVISSTPHHEQGF
jgi:hypothetical protein